MVLAEALTVPPVTEDRQMLAAIPQGALRMADFVAVVSKNPADHR